MLFLLGEEDLGGFIPAAYRKAGEGQHIGRLANASHIGRLALAVGRGRNPDVR